MNKRIISLCMILFILIICATVNAQDNTVKNDTNIITNETTIITSDINTDTIDIQQNTKLDAIKESDVTSDKSMSKNINKRESSINSQNVQSTDENLKIVKQNRLNNQDIEKVKEIPSIDNLNISGIVTTAYDKLNNTYAGGDEDGFVVSGVNITLSDENGILYNTTSNVDGEYLFSNLNPGKYTVNFNYGTYATGSESVTLVNESRSINHIFVPDITIITFSGDTSSIGQADKIRLLKEISDRFLFLESYELNNSYDNSNQWMLNYAQFILVDMFSIGNGFGIDTDLIAYSPASQKEKIAYTFGIFDGAMIQGTLANWGFLGGNPHSIENTYAGSYWQTGSESNSTVLKTNMQNFYNYIRYLLGETEENPTTNGNGPLLLSNSWGIYYPGFTGNVKTPTEEQINTWILSDPGYNDDGAGSLNWMTNEYSKWNLENNDPQLILRNFEDWYTTNKKEFNGSFIVISTYYEGGEVVDALIKEYEKLGRATFSIYKSTSETPDMTYLLEMAGNKSVIHRGVSAVSYMYWWTTGYAQRGGNYTINAYKNLNVSLINALKDISQFSYESEYGPQNEWTAAVTMPEFEGVFGAIPISYIDENKTTVIIKEGIAKHAQLTNGWANLHDLNNSDKKVSILVYGYPPGKANIGASYLDVFQSIHDLLEILYDEGYDIGMNKSEIPTTEELNSIITDFGNKGLWAEGLLDFYVIQHYDELTKNNQLVNEELFQKWYDELPKKLQQDLTDYWGAGLGNGSMVYREKVVVNFKELEDWLNSLPEDDHILFDHYWNLSKENIIISEDSEGMLLNKTRFYQWYFDLPSNLQKVFNQTIGFKLLNETKYKNEGYFLIPGKFFGNIFLSIQPLRGWESQIDFHNSYLPPPHQYIAYYKYLSQIFQTNAIIHMGTHGTLEWLPGRNLGLQSLDWPFQLIDTPIIYPYIVSNPGEGMVAKERSFAEVITHLTPVTSSTSLYGNYVELNDLISRYDNNKNSGVETNIINYQNEILRLAEDLGYDDPDYITVKKAITDYEIALSNEDVNGTIEAKNNLIEKAKLLRYDTPAEENFEEWLNDVQTFVNSNQAFDQWLAVIHENLEDMSADKINTGMHTLGEIWNDTDLITGVGTIVSSRTMILDDLMHLYYPDIKESYYDKLKDRTFNDKRDMLTTILNSIVTNLVEGSSVYDIATSYGIFDYTHPLFEDIVEINETIDNIRNNKEWYSIITALSGGYVEPGLAADPLYSDVLPTGRSMYVSDTTKIPSRSAWQSAVNSVDDLLEKYMVNLGEESFPEVVGEVIWGTEALRTEGISLAQFMYLLGVKPVWDKTGKVTGIEVIPLDELTITIDSTIYSRPRIDVFATIVCNNPDWLSLLTQSVEVVNALNESTTDNYVKKHFNETGSLERLFGLPGAILEGTGVSDYLNNAGTSLNESSDIAVELASVYESRIGHSWNVDDEGNVIVKDDGEAFAYLLEHVDLIIQNLDSTWRYLDSDDYLDWFGGLLNAATVHGTIVNTVLLDIRDKNTVVTSTLGEEVKKETRTTMLNPQWLSEMTDEIGGWNQMSQNFENLMKTMLTTQNYKENQAGKAVLDTSKGNNAGIIGNGLLRELARTVTYSEYFTIDAQYKSYAFQSMAGWLLTSDMAGYWKTEDNALRKDLLQKYVNNANRYGVACCHHTCGNINFHEWIIKTGTSLGVKGLSEYSINYASATKNPDAAHVENPESGSTASTDGTGTVDISEGISEYLNDGATGEANAMAMAGQNAKGFADSSSSIGMAASMTKTYNTGTGAGESGNNTGTGDVGEGNGTGTGTGSGDGDDSENSGSGSGNGTDDNPSESGEGTEQNPSDIDGNKNDTNTETSNNTAEETKPDENTNTTVEDITNATTEVVTNNTVENITNTTEEVTPPTEEVTNTTVDDDTNTTVDDNTNTTVDDNTNTTVDDVTNTTEEVTNTTEEVIPPTEEVTNSTEEVTNTTVDDVTNTTEEVTNTTEEVIPPTEEVTNSTEEVTNTTVEEEKHNSTVVDTSDTGAGETPSEVDPSESTSETTPESTPEIPPEATPESSSDSSSQDVPQFTDSPVVSMAGDSSASGSAGSSAGAKSVYEVVKKNLGKPPSSQSEIAIGYLLFIILLLGIFFFGFARPNVRDK